MSTLDKQIISILTVLICVACYLLGVHNGEGVWDDAYQRGMTAGRRDMLLMLSPEHEADSGIQSRMFLSGEKCRCECIMNQCEECQKVAE